MRTSTMTQEKIRTQGLDALQRALGAVGMVRFLQQFESGQGDYTVERGKWLDPLSLEQILRGKRSSRKQA